MRNAKIVMIFNKRQTWKPSFFIW